MALSVRICIMQMGTYSNTSKPLKVGHHRSTSETPFEWHFADGLLVVRQCMFAWSLTDWDIILYLLEIKDYFLALFRQIKAFIDQSMTEIEDMF